MQSRKIYWLCQLGGWLGMVAIETINYTFFIIGKFNASLFWWMIAYAALGIFFTHIYRAILKKTDFFRKKAVSIWLIAFLSTFLISSLLFVSGSLIPALIENPVAVWKQTRFIDIAGNIINWSRYVGVWVIIYSMYRLQQQNSTIQKEKLVIENLAKTTELELLKTQLNPHFLFNALNSIKALVTINPEQSRDAIVKLSELLRFTLQYGKERLIPLSDEIAEVKKYLSLEQLRFGPRLQVMYEINENTLSQTIPPAIVLTLAENAVKHGVARQASESTIFIRAVIEQEKLWIQVMNGGVYQPVGDGGIGLQHITKRLEEIFHHTALFTITQEAEHVVATIQLPVT